MWDISQSSQKYDIIFTAYRNTTGNYSISCSKSAKSSHGKNGMTPMFNPSQIFLIVTIPGFALFLLKYAVNGCRRDSRQICQGVDGKALFCAKLKDS